MDWKQRHTYLQAPWQQFRKRWEIICGSLIILLAIAVWPVPQWTVRREYWEWCRHPENYAKLVDDYRKTFVQIIGGAFLLYTLYLTQRRTKATEETLRLTQKTLEVTRETQIIDRFTKAITQLGADAQGKKQLEIRFGGIYALERIAKDSPADHWPIMEILTAYVRQNASRDVPKEEMLYPSHDAEMPQIDKDIQAIITVIGRANREYDKANLNLFCANLREGSFSKMNLSSADLRMVDLSKADLYKSDLRKANLCQANLDSAVLIQANLKNAKLKQANLGRANLCGAELSEADLRGADMWKANLTGANLTRARLKGTNLGDASLRDANLEGAELSDMSLHGVRLDGANLNGASLKGVVNLSQDRLNAALGDYTTELPRGLTHPEHWLRISNEQS